MHKIFTKKRLKPNEAYPKEQIKKIEQILSGIADQKANKKAYKSAIAKGDRAFKKEDWEEAKEAYFAALKAQPEETYGNLSERAH